MGLSLVSTNAAVAALEKEGILKSGELIPSGGGRPVREYHYNNHHGAVALITATPETHCTLLHFELLDMQGRILEETAARFVQIHAESLDEWIDAAGRRHRIQKICLPVGYGNTLSQHLQERYSCKVQEYSAAEALDSGKEDTLTLLLLRGGVPEGAIYRHGHSTPCPLLRMLPMPANWESLDYNDHTLVEEMLARLLQLLTCTMTPANINMYADFWTDRLISRLNYNLSTKLRQPATFPKMRYYTITSAQIPLQLRKGAAKI